MAGNATSTLIKVAAIGGAGYLAWQWWQGQQAAAPSTSPSSGTSVPAPTPSVPTAAAYNGPSLATLYQQMLAAAQAGYASGNPGITCPSPASMAGFGATRQTLIPERPNPTRIQTVPFQQGGSNTPSCSNMVMSFDGWNYYLMRTAAWGQLATSVVTSTAAGFTGDQQITAQQFWGAVAPLLQAQVQGLSGLGYYGRPRGFGSYRFRGLGQSTMQNPYATIVAGDGTDEGSDSSSSLINPYAALVGSYATASAPPAQSASGISGGAIALLLGGGLLFAGLASR